jgi:catechol 2,3-dioxygenase-like lactoylglutathione lyase family enzyme
VPDPGPVERVTPFLRCEDALATADWYARLGFEVRDVYHPRPDDPRFVALRAGERWLFLSEHTGDASPDTLIYLHVEDVDGVADAFGAEAADMPWGMREVHLTDPAGNRVRVGWRSAGA